MERQRDVAGRAAKRPAAAPAVERRSEAPAVEEEDRLAATVGDLTETGEQGRRQRIAALPAQVDDADRRERRAEATAQLDAVEQRPALRPRRRGAEDGDRSLEGRPLGGHGPRVVARIRLVLVRRIVLLVDADDAEPLERREHGGAGAHDDARLPAGDPLALVAALGFGEARVEAGHGVAEASAEAGEDLRGEGDLRHEHDRGASALERLGARAEIDLGLPAAGRTVQKEARSRSEGRHDSLQRRLLRRGQGERPSVRLQPAGGRALLAGTPCSHSPLGRDEGERASRRRAVVVRDPEGEVDERRRDRSEHTFDRDRLDPGGRVLGELRDDPPPPRRAEPDRDDRALLEPVAEVGERAGEGTRGDEREDGGVERHEASVETRPASARPRSATGAGG